MKLVSAQASGLGYQENKRSNTVAQPARLQIWQ